MKTRGVVKTRGLSLSFFHVLAFPLGSAESIEQLGSEERVYNLEIHGEQVFRVAFSGVPVHNSVGSQAPKGGGVMNEAGQLGGELYPAEKILGLVKYLYRRGIHVHEAANGSFDGVRGVMTLPRNPTKLNVQHELSHMLDYRKYGDDYYKLFTPAQREQMVLERLKKNRLWDKLNDAERDWSLKYPSTRQ